MDNLERRVERLEATSPEATQTPVIVQFVAPDNDTKAPSRLLQQDHREWTRLSEETLDAFHERAFSEAVKPQDGSRVLLFQY